MTLLWLGIRTADGIVHAFRRRLNGGPRWKSECGRRLLLPENRRQIDDPVKIDEIVDCMTCLVHEERS